MNDPTRMLWIPGMTAGLAALTAAVLVVQAILDGPLALLGIVVEWYILRWLLRFDARQYDDAVRRARLGGPAALVGAGVGFLLGTLVGGGIFVVSDQTTEAAVFVGLGAFGSTILLRVGMQKLTLAKAVPGV